MNVSDFLTGNRRLAIIPFFPIEDQNKNKNCMKTCIMVDNDGSRPLLHNQEHAALSHFCVRSNKEIIILA